MSSWIRSNRLLAIGILLTALWAGFFVFEEFTTNPRPWYDEGGFMQLSRNLASHGIIGLQFNPGERPSHGWVSSASYPLIAPVAVAYKIFGVGILQGRVVSATFLVLFLVTAFWYLRDHVGPRYALLGLALMVTFAPLYGNGKPVLGEVPGMFYFLLGMVLFARAEKIPTQGGFFLAGLMAGLGAVTKPTFFLLYPAFLFGLILRWRRHQVQWREDGACALGIVLPWTIWAAITIPWGDPLEFSLLLKHFSNQYGEQDVLGRMLANLRAVPFESTLLHFVVLAALGFMAWIFDKGQRTTTRIIILSFVVINFMWYLKSPGWFRYIFPAHLLVLALAPVAMWRLPLAWRRAGIAVLIALIAVQAAHLTRRYRDFASTSTRDFSVVLQTLPADKEIFVPDELELVALIPHENYSQLFVQPNLFTIGPDRLLAGAPHLPYYIAAGRASYPYLEKRKNILDAHYAVRDLFGHYRLYECVRDCDN